MFNFKEVNLPKSQLVKNINQSFMVILCFGEFLGK